MDLNPVRRKRERKIAQDVATEFSFNVDGRTLAQTVIEQMESLTEHATGSPNYNGVSHFNRADGGIAST